nr:efflux RND transporter periplasmic adaptor subunit [Prevotella sp.]
MNNYGVMMAVTMIMMSTACTDKKQNKSILPIPVKTMTVANGDENSGKSYVGTVQESYGSALSFASVGTVKEVLVDEGQAVRKGQILAILDNTNAKNSYDIAHSTLEQARDAFRRMDLLHKNGSLPEIKYVEIQTKLAEAQSAERIAKKNLHDCVLRAPFSGYISQRTVDIGNNVMPGFSCFKLVKLEQIEVKISVPEKEISGIRIGYTAQFTVSALGNRLFYGKITKKGVQADPVSHTYEVTISLPNNGHELLPGMVCNVILSSKGSVGIIVPQEAILIDGKEQYVWKAEGDSVKRQQIETGDINNKGAVVRSGLSVGDKIVVSGQNKLSEGSKIKGS